LKFASSICYKSTYESKKIYDIRLDRAFLQGKKQIFVALESPFWGIFRARFPNAGLGFFGLIMHPNGIVAKIDTTDTILVVLRFGLCPIRMKF
jgi:hypothetical protein